MGQSQRKPPQPGQQRYKFGTYLPVSRGHHLTERTCGVEKNSAAYITSSDSFAVCNSLMLHLPKIPASVLRLAARACAVFVLAVMIIFVSSNVSIASDAGDAAAEAAANQAAAQAADSAAAQAADSAAAQAADSAAAQAADSAAAQAADNAATQAADSAAAQAADSAAAQAADSAATQAADAAAAQTTDPTIVDPAAADALTSKVPNDGGDDDARASEAGNNDKAGNESVVGTSQLSKKAPDDEENVTGAIPITIGQDFDGSEIRAHEVVVLLNVADEAAVRNLGFKVVKQTFLGSLGGQLLRIRVPDETDIADALRAIRNAAPDAVTAANHIYRIASEPIPPRHIANPSGANGKHDAVRVFRGLVGVIDTPVDMNYPGLGAAVSESRSFADGAPADSTHGTAVAEIIAQRHVRVIAANVFAKDVHGVGAATTDAILSALNWLVSRRVTVINMSIEGPLDSALGEAIRRAQAKGAIIVAAAGNDGPAAPPAYPGAFPAVIAVTAIDKHDRIYPYANQGPYISFAALGVGVYTARPPDGRQLSSGTSFAAPIVAAQIAALYQKAPVETADAVLARLEKRARHLGPPGRNPMFGYGALDAAISTAK
ncbi:MAG: S8 family serine peptidase [Alphaproteobacteria bacterium]|nr:S8 family serine peptidase [Alphaproteobacteria bacterium]